MTSNKWVSLLPIPVLFFRVPQPDISITDLLLTFQSFCKQLRIVLSECDPYSPSCILKHVTLIFFSMLRQKQTCSSHLSLHTVWHAKMCKLHSRTMDVATPPRDPSATHRRFSRFFYSLPLPWAWPSKSKTGTIQLSIYSDNRTANMSCTATKEVFVTAAVWRV